LAATSNAILACAICGCSTSIEAEGGSAVQMNPVRGVGDPGGARKPCRLRLCRRADFGENQRGKSVCRFSADHWHFPAGRAKSACSARPRRLRECRALFSALWRKAGAFRGLGHRGTAMGDGQSARFPAHGADDGGLPRLARIARPIRLLDCAYPVNGASRSSSAALPKPASPGHRFTSMGSGQGHAGGAHFGSEEPELITGGETAAKTAYAMAGIGPSDISIAEFYAPFTCNGFVSLEDSGFCRRGEAAAFVADGTPRRRRLAGQYRGAGICRASICRA